MEINRNFPNPFNPATLISYHLPMTSEVELTIYNTLGQKVTTLVSEKQQAGYYEYK
ncbi:MAG: T9SS type A sorting domain-containing protein [Calditrichae bacterium]|nr:T9SS type A sorting domain-containing protein [bacterium]NOQ97016.1 T9SS type A sorting domain-containing protein [Calditrichia bacterium]